MASTDIGLPRSVALCAVPELRFLMADLARRIMEEWKADVHLYCRSPQEAGFYTERYGLRHFTSINIVPNVLELLRPLDAPGQDIVRRFASICKRTGLTLGRLMLVYRQLGHGFLLGAFHHPRSTFDTRTSYPAIAAAFCDLVEFWERALDERSIDLLLNGLPDQAVLCRRRTIPFRSLRHGRYQNLHYWAHDEFAGYPSLPATLEQTVVSDDDVVAIDEPYLTELALRRKFERDNRFRDLLRRIAYTILRHAYWRLRGYEKAKRTNAWQDVGYLWRKWRHARQVSGPRAVSLAEIEGRKFVFFPLQTEPEATLMHGSPEYFFQLDAVHALARALPAGVTLAVKESLLAAGRRPDGFYDRIRALPNTVLVDMLEQGVDVIRSACAVVTITSTAGLEALATGKRVVLLGRHNFFGCAAHAQVVTDLERLPEALAWATEPSAPAMREDLEGARLLKAHIRSCFSLGDYDYLKLDRYMEDDVNALLEALVSSVHAGDPAPHCSEAGG